MTKSTRVARGADGVAAVAAASTNRMSARAGAATRPHAAEGLHLPKEDLLDAPPANPAQPSHAGVPMDGIASA